ncbi:Fic family protein [Curtobacterium sp. VKM Ac-2922]|uniref:Fic family protein n=1 Tax=Curtobacterium sp. VKM Ac-2922 TaxID=2929475 RepID=UPI001FB49EC7|nr:Fic family protein [Curtobacterium sp. VKM Ac-2922]MCJ1715960.1 Fic family protein [Curtobacterium sp. VKM Ac-2922]
MPHHPPSRHSTLPELAVHTSALVPWRSALRGSRADRLTTSIRVSIPPHIADIRYRPQWDHLPLLDRATDALRDLDQTHGERLAPLGGLLTRTEAVASSRIEDEHADLVDYARAVVGSRANDSASLMVAATTALRRMQDDAATGAVTTASLLRAHHDLLRDDPVDGHDAGRWRTVQNWIGGGRSPRLASYVPPPPELVPELMDDLLAFVARDDLHPVAQAAIAHAQFESIHPFTDGNGRIGRALIGAVLRRRGVTRSTTVPVATALVADRARYFDHLVRYRSGTVHDFVADLAVAIGTACDEAALTALVLDERAASGDPLHVERAGNTDPLLTDVVLTEDQADAFAHAAGTTTDGFVDPLVRTGRLRAVTTRRRNRAWLVVDVADELDALAERVGAAVHERALRSGLHGRAA